MVELIRRVSRSMASGGVCADKSIAQLLLLHVANWVIIDSVSVAHTVIIPVFVTHDTSEVLF